MNKVLIFGDSHVAQLAIAYQQNSQNTVEFEFVTGPGPVSQKLRFEGHYLHLDENNGVWPYISSRPDLQGSDIDKWYENTKERFMAVAKRNPIDLHGFDAVVLYGGYVVPDNWWQFAVNRNYYSKALILELLVKNVQYTAHYKWLQQIIGFIKDGGKVLSQLPPLRSELGFGDVIKSEQDLSQMKLMPKDISFHSIEPLYELLFKNNGASLIPLPRELYSDDFRATHKRYKSQNEQDYGHVNPAGGKLIFDNLIRVLSEH
jgi:hypothetical protein